MSPRKKSSHAKNGFGRHRSPDDSIAIVGIGCRYPGISNPTELWDALMAGTEVLGPYPGGRFADLDGMYEQAARGTSRRVLTDRGGFLADVAGFDAQFFEISPRESIYIDPQHRLLMEVAWEALEDAGQVREKYEGSATGVYTGLWTNEYEARLYESATEMDFYSVTGCGRASASGRLSFTFGLQGPSVTVDSACSSSLVAVQMACDALRSGEIDMALAGGANLILGPEISELFTKAKMLSPDGKCKFGDASANGFVRSEGAGMVVLKRLSCAVADKDPVYAVIRGGAVNNDGRSSGLLVTPSRVGQHQMLQRAWKSAGISPTDLRYVEMHGTGTSVGDPVEVEALGTALAEAGVTESCALGSIKTNVGHTESAAGVSGVIKAALALQHRVIPPSLHFKTPNPKIAWENIPVHVAVQAIDLADEPGPLLAGVNSFGITGTNAHVVLEESEREPERAPQTRGPYLLPISARSPEALDLLLRSHLRQMQEAGSEYPIHDACYTAGVRRNHHEYRVAIVGHDLDELERNLAGAIANESSDGVISGRAAVGEHKIVFVLPGQGSQWLGMARELFDGDPVFRRAFEHCDVAITEETGWRLADRVLGPNAERYLTDIDVIQPALFAMSVALEAVWRGWGVEPDAVVGHSMGEVAAAHIAGILNLQDAVAVICRRSRLMKTLRSAGSMATVELPLGEVEGLLKSWEGVSVGASNGPHTTVISGDAKAIEALLRELEGREVYCRQIKVDVASHSAQVDPILAELLVSLAGIRPQAAKTPMLSTVTGEYDTPMDAAYWVENLRRSVLFSPAIQRLAAAGHDTFIELSPHPILLPSTETSAREMGPGALAVASLRREKPARVTMLAGLAALYVAGRKIAWDRMYPEDARCVRLPQYPFQRERCWPEPADPARARTADDSNSLLGWRFESSLHPNTFFWESHLQIASVSWLNDHRVLRSAVFPASGHIDLALCAAKVLEQENGFEVRHASFLSAAYIPDQGSKPFQVALTPDGSGGFAFEIHSHADEGETVQWPLRSKGVLQRVQSPADTPEPVSIRELKRRYKGYRDAGDHYGRTAKSGLQYGPAFQLVHEVWVGESESLCRLEFRAAEYGGQSVIHPTVLDACFQAMAHVRPEQEAFHAEDTYLPVTIETVRLYRAIPNDGNLYAQAKLLSADAGQGTFRANMRLLDPVGQVLIDVSGMEVKRVARQSETAATQSLHTIDWVKEHSVEKAHEKAEGVVARLSKISLENWVIFADSTGVADAMKESLESAGGRCTLVRPGSRFRKIAEAEFEIDPGSALDVELLFTAISGIPTAVVHLWTVNNQSGTPYDAEGLILAQAIGSQHVPAVVQAIAAANWPNPPRLWLITPGAMVVGEESAPPRIENSTMWGIGRTVAREHAELRSALVDLSRAPDLAEARNLVVRICADGKEDRVALRGTGSYVARVQPLADASSVIEPKTLAQSEQYRVEIAAPGILDNLQLRSYGVQPPRPGEVVIEVAAAGLNFIDVTKVMGIYPGLDPAEPIQLGIECCGRVTSVGESVSAFKRGDEVVAITPSMRTTALMASSISVPADMVFPKPGRLSVDEAATVSIAYLTAYYSLVELARLGRGEWVLIHAAAGGVGLAAIEIARWAGANIVATAGSSDKVEYLRSIGIEHVFNSRSLDFAAAVMEITNGRGVDVVLNSLTGEFIAKGLEVLASYGRFIELGKRDIYDDRDIGLKVFRKNISFHAVDLAAAIEERRDLIVRLVGEILRNIETGEWKALPVRTFSAANPAEPFRFMAQALHIGKIALRMDRDVQVLAATDRKLFSANASYLLTGGLGGVALTVAEWMAQNGTGHLVLLSRRAATEEMVAAIRRMEEAGAIVTSIRGDVMDESDIAAVVQRIRSTMLPLKGIMHTAAVVDDALITDLSPERFVPVIGPKIAGTWNLHAATLEDDLDFFVLFSSIAAVHPQPGMGSYAAANAFLDAFAYYRSALGKPATSVNWGGWNQIGLARAAGTGRSIEGYEQQGMPNFSGPEALEALGRTLAARPVQVIAVPFDWERFAEFHAGNAPPAFSEMVSRSQGKTASESNRPEILERLGAADSADRPEILEAFLQETLGRVLKLATNRIDRERPLGSMGLDSLMGLEFVRRLSNSLQIAVPATVVFNYPTVKLLATHLLNRMQLNPVETLAVRGEGAPDKSSTSGHAGVKNELRGELPEMSEEEALQALMGDGQRSS